MRVKAKARPQPATSGDTDAALSSMLAIASVGIATLNMLETLLPAAAREVEHESNRLSAHFTTLVEYINGTDNPPQRIKNAIGGVILGMQFQDRNTQIMENVTCILERYRSMLEDISRNIEAMRAGQADTAHNMAEAVAEILSSIRLSDIRTRYLEALQKAQVHADEGNTATDSAEPVDDIELF